MTLGLQRKGKMLLQYQLEHLPLLEDLRKIEVEKCPIWEDLTNKLFPEHKCFWRMEMVKYSTPYQHPQGRQPHNLSAAVKAYKQNAKKH